MAVVEVEVAREASTEATGELVTRSHFDTALAQPSWNAFGDDLGLVVTGHYRTRVTLNMNDSPARIDPEEAAIGRPTPTAHRLVEASVSPNTRRAYAGALRRLDAWLDGRELHDVTLAAYLAELHDAGRASSSASMAVAAACFRAKLAGQPNPSGERTARVLAGYRRTAADRGRGQAGPFSASDLAAVLATCHRSRRRGRGVESDEVAAERGRVDAVIAGLLFMAGMRRSGVSVLRWSDVVDATDGDGVLVRIRISKTNQEGEVNDVRFVKDGVARAIRKGAQASGPGGAPATSWAACAYDGMHRRTCRRRPAQRRHGAAVRFPAAKLEVEPAAAYPTRPPPLGDGGIVPPARRIPRRRRLAGAVAPLRRHQEGTAVGPRRRRCRPQHAGQFALDEGLHRLDAAARAGAIPGGSIDNGMLRIERMEAAVPDGAGDLVADLYRQIPDVRITDILIEVDNATRFTEAFTHLRTGSPCRDRIGLLNVLLAEGINLGLRKMAEATTTHGFWELMRIARWHVEGEA